jgi:hypothetical protein
MKIQVGLVYRIKGTDRFTRIFRSGGGGHFSGRGCTQEDAIPYNAYREHELEPATLKEVNDFLELEMESGMAQKQNVGKA